MNKVKYIFSIVSLLLIGANAFAAGLSVTPSKIDETVGTGAEFRTSLTVSNPTQDVSLIEVYPDDLVQFVHVEPRSFTLEPAAERDVSVVLNFTDEGVYSTFVSVVARPLGDRTFKAGSGIKIPLNVTVEEGIAPVAEEKHEYDLALIGVIVLDVGLLVLLVGLVVYRIRRQRMSKKK